MKKIKETRYIARVGATFKSDKAEELGKYLESRKLDLNNYKAIYEDAKVNEQSPFRSELEWDNNQAAEEYRLSQIRDIVQHISIEIVYEDEQVITLPRAVVLVSKYDDAPQQLVGIIEGLSEEDSRKQIISRAYQNLLGWWNTHNSYQEFSKLEQPIDQIRNELIQKKYISS